MQTVLLVVHLLIALSLVGVVMLQKSEGGGLGLGGGGGGGMSGFMTGRSTANLLTRTTGILFAALMVSSVVLTVLAAHQHASRGSILDQIPAKPMSLQTTPAAPAPAGTVIPPLAHDPDPSKPSVPVENTAPKPPSVPLAH